MRLLSLLILMQTIFSQLNQSEKEIVKYVDQHNQSAIQLLEKIVNINSGSMNFKGVKMVHDIIADNLSKLGFTVEWKDGSEWGRAGHLIAQHRGKGKKILLIGHLDTVFELESPFQTYEKVDEHTIKGPGVDDMKGGDVVIILAMQALHDAGLLKDMNIDIVMTGDEELSGRPLYKARFDLINSAKWADIALGFENGDGDPTTAIVARRSSSNWKLTVSGVPSHSSQVFSESVGAGAIFEAARILNEFYEQLSNEENLTFNPGLILGGTAVDHEEKMDAGRSSGKVNIVAKDAVVTGDIRAISPEQLYKARLAMQEIVKKNRPKTNATLFINDGYPPLAPSEGNYRLLGHFSKASQDLGFGEVKPVDPRKAGAADVSFTSNYVDMAIDGLGLGGANDHTVNETADLRTLPMQAKRAAVLIYRLTSGVIQ